MDTVDSSRTLNSQKSDRSHLGYDLANKYILRCKLCTIALQPFRLLIGSVICFEAIERYLSTHSQAFIRQLSTSKLAKYLVGIIFCLWLLHSIPYLMFYDIIPQYRRIIKNQILVYYYSCCYYIFLNGLLPMFISSVFSIFAYRNVRHIVQL